MVFYVGISICIKIFLFSSFFFQEYLKPVLVGSDEQAIATARNVLYPFISFYKIESVFRRISLDERHFLSEYRETFDVIHVFITAQRVRKQCFIC